MKDGSVSYESYFPGIILVLNKFELDGYGGDMTSWEKFWLLVRFTIQRSHQS